MAITWRSVSNPIANDQADFFKTGTSLIKQGISGIGNLAGNVARDMDADQLNEALARIRNLNTVEGAQQAQQNNLVGSLGLNDEQQIQARNALDSQLTGNRQSVNASDAFDANQLAKREQPLINDFNVRLANNDFAGANEIGSGLSNSGELLRQSNQQQAAFDANNLGIKNTAISNASANFENAGDFENAIRSAQQVPNNAREVGRLQDEQKAVESDNLFKSFANGVAGTENQGIAGAFGGGDQAYKGTLDIINQDSNLSLEQKNILSNLTKAQQSRDPRAIAESKQAVIEQAISEAETKNKLKQNPIDPALTPQEGLSLSDVYNEFEPLTQTEDGFFTFGVGDFKDFQKKTNVSVNKGYMQDVFDDKGQPVLDAKGQVKQTKAQYNPVVVKEALNQTSAVAEARNFGNLGDSSWISNSNINESEFENLLRLYQAKYDDNINKNSANLFAEIQNIRAGNL